MVDADREMSALELAIYCLSSVISPTNFPLAKLVIYSAWYAKIIALKHGSYANNYK